MKLPLDFITQATAGTPHLPDSATQQNCSFNGVSIDSRTLTAGQLFVPLMAASNGHDYIEAAAQAGAAGYLTSQEPLPLPIPAVQVADTQAALLELSQAARQQLAKQTNLAVIGITGSVGKTSTKDFLAQILSSAMVCSASEKSFNNYLGVPLTILNAATDCQALVVELGASAVGEIAQLCETAQPNYGVLTAIGAAHLEGFGSLENLCQAKGELLEALPPAGVAVLNCDDERVMAQQARTQADTTLTFGTSPQADVQTEKVELNELCQPRYTLKSPWGSAQVNLNVAGLHNVPNSLAAAAVALHLGLTVESVTDQLAQAQLSPWRMDLQQSASGIWVLNDAYNANPTSVKAALRTLAALPAKRKVAVLGTMAELGDFHASAHQDIAELANELELELLAIDEPAYGTPPEPDHKAALAKLAGLSAGDAVLVKASRSAGLEDLAQTLLEL